MKLADEKGVALIMVLILTGVLSVIASSLIFVSQTETWASQNYRLMSEARYGAESGIHKAANYLVYTYSAPGTVADPMSNYDITKSSVESPIGSGHPVQLRSNGSSNYPVSSVVTAFGSAATGTLTGGHLVTYNARATLVSMRRLPAVIFLPPVTVQTWQIVGEGSIGGAKPARVDVSAILERQVSPMFSYAAFATDNGCGALTWSGGGTTDSYDSTAPLVGGMPVFLMSDGNVGTNGNLDVNGNVTTIHGSLSTPRSGVGGCSAGAITALTTTQADAVTGGVIELPQPVDYPTPGMPNPLPTGPATTIPKTGANNNQTWAPGSYGNITVKGTLHLTAGTYNINSLNIDAGGGTLKVDSGPVILNVAGLNTPGNLASGWMNAPIDLTGQAQVFNTKLDPALLQISYAGTANIKLAGGADAAALLYAPNATVHNDGNNVEWYGAIIAKKVTDVGHATIHYDRNLATTFLMVGPWMMDSFTWRRF